MEMGIVSVQPGQGEQGLTVDKSSYIGVQGLTMAHPGVPVGNIMDVLKELDYIKIRQKVDLLEMLTGWEVANKYEIFDNQDRMLLTVTEESSTCERQCCGPLRGFVLHIQDVAGTEVARIHREYKLCAGCCPACANTCPYELWVDSPVGHNVAHVQERSCCCYPNYRVLTNSGETMFEGTGPCCCFCQGPGCTADLDFPIDMPGGVKGTAKVTKVWDGVARGCCTNANTFACHFPKNLDINRKLGMLGCVFELDFLFFEYQGDGGN